ncbi:hypothetical protein GmHk_06G015540 [Glycine max]|nr:hypothetical protein GmHk_06G015540 [Glycine max]
MPSIVKKLIYLIPIDSGSSPSMSSLISPDSYAQPNRAPYNGTKDKANSHNSSQIQTHKHGGSI